jgi:glutathione S-transferase
LKLFHSPASPYVRKVVVTAAELGLTGRVEHLPSAAHPINRDETVAALNPVGKVPTLILDDGTPLYDSRVICEYLDALDGRHRIFPPAGAARWRALREQALGDAMLDAALLARYESLARPAEVQWQAWIDGQLRKVSSALDVVEAEADGYADRFDIGTLTLACAIGYLDFRFPHLQWRNGRPRSMAWFGRATERPSMVDSSPRT